MMTFRELIAEEGVVEGAKYSWHPLGLTQNAWQEQLRRRFGNAAIFQACHQGTLMRTARGVFAAGMCGSIYVGQKREDGSVQYDVRPEESPVGARISENGRQEQFEEVVLEIADPEYGHGCKRLPDGRIHCECDDW